MSLPITSPAYPFDPAGHAATNLIVGEQQALTGAIDHDFYFLVPDFAPYFEDSLVVIYKDVNGNSVILDKGVHYYPSHFFLGATRACGAAIYGSVMFLDRTLKGVITFRYQTLGGEWVQNSAQIAEILADRRHNPRIITWEQVQDKPVLFPVIDHEWNLKDMVGMTQLVESINRICDFILMAGNSLSEQHINNHENPHQVTAQQLGAITHAQAETIIRQMIQDLGGGSSDNLTEGDNNLFFTEERVLATLLGTLPTGANAQLTPETNLLQSLMNLQAQIAAVAQALTGKLDKANTVFTGLSASHLETIDATTATTKLNIASTPAWRINIKANTAIQFDTSFVQNASGNVVEFSLTTVNDGTAGRLIAWPANVKWAGGFVPPRTTAANARDDYYFYSDDGMSTWTGSLANENVK